MSVSGTDYSPGLKGVVAGETSLAMIDGAQGRLLYRGYPIGELVERGTYAQVAELLWTGEWPSDADRVRLVCAPLPAMVIETLRQLPAETNAMDALRTGLSAWGAEQGLAWPPTAEQAREVTAAAPSVLAAYGRIRDGLEPVVPDSSLPLAAGFLYQLHEMGSPAEAEAWIRAALARGERLMGFGHRVYRAYDPRAAALRKEAEGLASVAGWLQNAIAIEEIALRLLAEHKPDYPIKTNVEYYAAAVLQGVGLPPNLFPATFALARHAGWTAHALEQAAANVLIRPDVRYIGPAERHFPAG